MKIAVCIKQTPVVSMLRFDNETNRLVREGVPSEINYFDILGMSAAMNLKRTMSAEVVVLTMGPPQAREALVQCLAMGADRAVHLVDKTFAGSDTLATARALSTALSRENFDLIICGRNSVDAETSQVGPEIAEMLDLPQVTNVRRLLEVAESERRLTAERLTDTGYDVVRCPLPTLITATEGIAPEVYPSREAMEATTDKPIVELTAVDLSEETSIFGLQGSPTWVGEIYSIEPQREGIVLKDRPIDEAVDSLLDYLERRQSAQRIRSIGPQRTPRGPRRPAGRVGTIWVMAEILASEVRPVTLELLGRARELADQVHTTAEAVLIGGNGVDRHVPTLTAYGADCVHLAQKPHLAQYETELFTALMAEATRKHQPYAILMPSTINGRDLAARVAARLGLGLTGDCIGLEINDQGRLLQLKPAFGGNVIAPILSKTTPQLASIRPGILTPVKPDWSLEPVVRPMTLDDLGEPRVEVLENVTYPSIEGAELERAESIVAVGKGVGGPDNIGIVRELAQALQASLGATREVTDLGWLPKQRQIGLSGKSVSPDLYVAVAVRGPFNHTVGIQKAGTVVAINNNARAPIFKAADFGIVGDYAQVVPALIRAIRKRRPPRDEPARTPSAS